MCKKKMAQVSSSQIAQISTKKDTSDKPENLGFSSLTTERVIPLLYLPCLVSEQLCVLICRLEKSFNYLMKLSRNSLEPLKFKCNLLLLRFFLGSFDLLWSFSHMQIKQSFTSLTFWFHWSFLGIIFDIVTPWSWVITLFSKPTLGWIITSRFLEDRM